MRLIVLSLFSLMLAINSHGQEADQHLAIAKEKAEIGDYLGAIESCNKALEVGPSFWGYFLRGYCKEKTEDHKGAIHDYKVAINLDKTFTEAYFKTGGCYAILEDHRTAISYYNKAIELDDKNAEYYYWRGIAYSKIDVFDRACADYKKAQELGDKVVGFMIDRQCK